MYPDHMWFGGWMMFPWFIFLILFILVIIYLGRRGFDSSRESPETPLEILKKRYARGEISKEEFDQMKKDIS